MQGSCTSLSVDLLIISGRGGVRHQTSGRGKTKFLVATRLLHLKRRYSHETLRKSGAGICHRPALPLLAVHRDMNQVETALRSQLLDARNDDGGWGYEASRTSRLEPTCWALLALGEAPAGSDRILADWPTQKGALLEQRAGLPNWSFHALALATRLALRAVPAAELQRFAEVLVDAPPRSSQLIWPQRPVDGGNTTLPAFDGLRYRRCFSPLSQIMQPT